MTRPIAIQPGPNPVTISLNPENREHLESLIRAAKSTQRDVLRARIVLLADEGYCNREISRILDCDEDTVGKWRQRFHAHGLKGLRDKPRSGRPVTFSADQKSRVLQKAIESPCENGRPFSHWDSSSLSKLAIEAGITQSIHPTTVWRWLNAADIKPHRVRYWLQSTDPDFEERMKDVTSLYVSTMDRNKKGMAVFSIDEKTGMQAKERKRPDLPVEPGVPQRIEHEYIRHGTLCLTAGLNVATGEVQGLLTSHRPAPVLAKFVRRLCESSAEASEIHLVMDQLNTHWHMELCKVVAEFSGLSPDLSQLKTGRQRREFLMRSDKRVVVHFTPKHASWLNQIEIWFSVLGRKLLNRESFSSKVDLANKVSQFIDYYNFHLAHPYRWSYTGTPCKS
jgi:transposase